MSQIRNPHAETRIGLERRILGGLTFHDDPGAGGELYAAVAQILPAPLARWMATPEHAILAEGIDAAALAGAPLCLPAVLDRLAAMAGERTATKRDELGPEIYQVSDGAYTHAATLLPAAKQLRSIIRQIHAVQILRDQAGKIFSAGAGEDPAGAIAATVDRLRELAVAGDDVNLGAAVTEALAEGRAARERRSSGGDLPATWGIDALDAACPLEPGRVYVLAAAPKCGKTSLAIAAALATAEAGARTGGKVAMASLEMTRREIASILVCRALGLRSRDLRQGRLDTDQERQVEAMAQAWMDADALYLRDATGEDSTCTAIVSWLRHRQQLSGGRLSLGVIDYLQLMAPEQPRWNEYQRISAHTRALKLAANALAIPLLVLCQLSRDGRREIKDRRSGQITANAEPGMSDLRGSGSIEQDADAVIFLHSPDQPREDEESRKVRFKVGAARHCTSGRTVDLSFYGSSQSFSLLTPLAIQRKNLSEEQRQANADALAKEIVG